jgi:hypothetical protein
MEEYQRWGLIINILTMQYLSIGSDIQNIKLEHNIEIKDNRPYKYLGSIFTNSGKCNEEVLKFSRSDKQQEYYIAYFGVNIFR